MRTRLKIAVDRMTGSQAEVARRLDLTPQRLNNYLQRGTLPDVETLARIAKRLNVTSDYLLGLNAPSVVEIAPVVERLLELDGMDAPRATVIADAVQEALRIASALPDEGDAALRSRMAAQTVWQSRGGLKPD